MYSLPRASSSVFLLFDSSTKFSNKVYSVPVLQILSFWPLCVFGEKHLKCIFLSFFRTLKHWPFSSLSVRMATPPPLFLNGKKPFKFT